MNNTGMIVAQALGIPNVDETEAAVLKRIFGNPIFKSEGTVCPAAQACIFQGGHKKPL
jgi:hypothetical protein